MGMEESREQFIARFDHEVVRLEDELDRMIKLVSMQRRALENEMFSGMAYKEMAVQEKGVKVLKDLTAACNSLTDSKVRLEKTAKDRAAKMTPEEEQQAVLVYLKSVTNADRAALLKKIIAYHNEANQRSSPEAHPMAAPGEKLWNQS